MDHRSGHIKFLLLASLSNRLFWRRIWRDVTPWIYVTLCAYQQGDRRTFSPENRLFCEKSSFLTYLHVAGVNTHLRS